MKVNLFAILFEWSYSPATLTEIESAQLMATMAWSRRKDGTPGNGNYVLAETARMILEKIPSMEFYPEVEIHDAMPEARCVEIAAGSSDGKSNTKDWNTRVVASWQAEYCREKGIRKIVVIAHPLHMNRVVWVYRKLGLEPIPAPVSWRLSHYNDPHLVHWSFRNHRLLPFFIAREIIARLYFWYKGFI